jgi:spermidine synthase
MPEDVPPGDLQPGVLTEYLTDDSGFFVRSSREFERFQTPYQTVEVHDTKSFGKLFRLDGHLMTSEKDEFFYHENLVHVAAITHPAPKTALIIGGGDGGSAEELLKYQSIESVTLVEIDIAVLDIARKYFAEVHHGALLDPRVSVKVEDGFGFVRGATDSYDLIVLDLTDPGGASEPLYGVEFYRACAARSIPPARWPRMSRRRWRIRARARRNGQSARGILSRYPVPGFHPAVRRLMDDGLRVSDAQSRLPHAAGGQSPHRDRGRDLQYYNGEIHRASMALPNFVRDLVA